MHLFPAHPHPHPPSSPGNTVRSRVWNKGCIAPGRGKPLRWLVILVLLTSFEVGYPASNKVEHTSTSPITFGKWNSQIGLCKNWTPDAPIRMTAPTVCIPLLSSCAEALEEATASGVSGKTPTGSECLGNASLEVQVFEGRCISQNYSHLGPDGWCHPWNGASR